MNDQRDLWPMLLEEPKDPGSVPNVESRVLVAIAEALLEPSDVPRGRGGVAEEDAAHVVVDTEVGEPGTGEMFGGLRADQAAGAGHHRYGHERSAVLSDVGITPLAGGSPRPSSSGCVPSSPARSRRSRRSARPPS